MWRSSALQAPVKDVKKGFHEATVFEKPFGMNIQVTAEHPYPRVVEVLPGFPAEKVPRPTVAEFGSSRSTAGRCRKRGSEGKLERTRRNNSSTAHP